MDSNKKIASIEVNAKTTISNQREKPWLNEKGRRLSDLELKVVSKQWDQKTWDAYLSSLNGTTSEQQIASDEYDYFAERMQSTWEHTPCDVDQDTKDFVANILNTLTSQQRKIITMIFWEGRSERYIADELGVYRTTVQTLKKRILRKLAQHFEGVSSNSPYMRGKNKLSLVKGDKNDTKDFKPKIIRRSAS